MRNSTEKLEEKSWLSISCYDKNGSDIFIHVILMMKIDIDWYAMFSPILKYFHYFIKFHNIETLLKIFHFKPLRTFLIKRCDSLSCHIIIFVSSFSVLYIMLKVLFECNFLAEKYFWLFLWWLFIKKRVICDLVDEVPHPQAYLMSQCPGFESC